MLPIIPPFLLWPRSDLSKLICERTHNSFLVDLSTVKCYRNCLTLSFSTIIHSDLCTWAGWPTVGEKGGIEKRSGIMKLTPNSHPHYEVWSEDQEHRHFLKAFRNAELKKAHWILLKQNLHFSKIPSWLICP